MATSPELTHEEVRRIEAANKKLVLDMWHAVIDARDPSQAPKYIVPDYIQHSPSADHGLQTVMDHFAQLWPEGPRAPGTYELTNFELVIAEGDLVQLMFRMKRPEPSDPSKTYDICWYDTYRCKDGMIIEHWDSALKK